ncbi:MAG: hypothetical protein Q8O83_04665 [bacterium]|nr:hypothetical protein [bacterium]
MALSHFFKKKNETEDKAFTCRKCGKEKKESEGKFVLEGTTFCCKECCGDPAKGEHKETKDGVCEFC